MYFYYYFWFLNNDRYATTILFRELGVPVVIAVSDFDFGYIPVVYTMLMQARRSERINVM